MPLVDDPKVEGRVYWHGGRWVDANGNEVSKKDANRLRKQAREEETQRPVTHEPPPDEPADDDDDEEVAYEAMSKAELVAEVQSRNEDPDRAEEDHLPEEGTKAQLVAALEADDAEE